MTDGVELRPDEYVYVQIADAFAERIEHGELTPGARLPSEMKLAEEYGVARLTARRAVRELVTRGLVKTLPGKGTFVIERQDVHNRDA
ncbi:GntR family transcriptional regulator [Actinoallomurus purpureus]|uniref:GntR family transcriptional regulator n=1 Tax=Actinoallomurus purpureus TaxID=478114 RepID=UPI002092ECD2|nr:GntR family transcriptional regulator [Actinoallomurus purpureus]MCO6005641.1 GntR family transcriptional regulator [Actinoallomurus purpureus]